MPRLLYEIAGLTLRVIDEAGVAPLESFQPFALDDSREDSLRDAPRMSVTLRPYDERHAVVPDESAMDLLSEDLVNRLYMWDKRLVKRTAMREGDPRCMWTIMPASDYSQATVYIPSDWLDYENYGNAFLFEKMLLSHGAIMLHCSLIDTAHGGIAFTAPSQTGKSTQANLWRAHRNARVINGDRAIIRAHDDGIYAYGSPWAGSSEVYLNQRVKLAALVALSQAPDDTVRTLSPMETLSYIMIGTSLPLWDTELFDKGMAAIERVITDVPAVMLACTKEIGAVMALEDFFKWR